MTLVEGFMFRLMIRLVSMKHGIFSLESRMVCAIIHLLIALSEQQLRRPLEYQEAFELTERFAKWAEQDGKLLDEPGRTVARFVTLEL